MRFFSIIFILVSIFLAVADTVDPSINPFNVLSRKLDSVQRVITVNLEINTDMQLQEVVLTDPDGREFHLIPERSSLSAGMQPTYQFEVQAGTAFRIGTFHLRLIGKLTALGKNLSHDATFEVK